MLDIKKEEEDLSGKCNRINMDMGVKMHKTCVEIVKRMCSIGKELIRKILYIEGVRIVG